MSYAAGFRDRGRKTKKWQLRGKKSKGGKKMEGRTGLARERRRVSK